MVTMAGLVAAAAEAVEAALARLVAAEAAQRREHAANQPNTQSLTQTRRNKITKRRITNRTQRN